MKRCMRKLPGFCAGALKFSRWLVLLVVVGLAWVPAAALPNTEPNRSAAADRCLAAVLDSPSRNGVIKAFLLGAHLDGIVTEGDADQALARLDSGLFKAEAKRVLVNRFTADELSALADFYGSPSGQWVARKTPEFNRDLLSALKRNEWSLFGRAPGTAGREGTFLLGAVAPMTGEAATFGQSAKQGAELAVKEWNSKGGVLGRKITLLVRDDRGDASEGQTAFRDLIQRDHVSAIVGPVMSKVALAGAFQCQRASVPMVAFSATNTKVTAEGDFIFRACFIDPWQGTIGAQFCYQNLHARKAACLFDVGNDYTRGLSEYFRARFSQLGGRIVGFESHYTGADDFRGQLGRILAQGPDVLYVSDYYNDVALIARQARALGFIGPIVGGDGWDSPRLVEVGGQAVENCYFTNHYCSDDPHPEVAEFIRNYRAEFGAGNLDALAALGYDAVNIMLDAVRRAGSADGAAIRDALRTANLPTLCGRLRFDEHRNPVKSAVIIKIQNHAQRYFTRIDP